MRAQANLDEIQENIRELSNRFARERGERQRRRELVQADFDQLKDTGFLLSAVPIEQGSIWESTADSMRPVCEMLRTLAHGDSSVALVSAMHPAVIFAGGWLILTEAPPAYKDTWAQQRDWIFQTIKQGHQWAVIASEPGSGGDTSKTTSIARNTPSNGQYLMSGRKHFGSGSGIASFMITSAIPEGETGDDTFYLDMRNIPWDGSAGVKLIAEWDGHGMTATQSHAMDFQDFPAVRAAWPGARPEVQKIGFAAGCMFSAVILGVLETAIYTARQQLEGKRASMRAYEQAEWTRVEIEGWLAQQAYQGMLRSIEESNSWADSVRLGKAAIAELAESVMLRICKVIGGSSYSRRLPYGFWLEDVRALGFLRPPWGLAFDQIFSSVWDD